MKLTINHNPEYDQWVVVDLDDPPDLEGRRLILAEFGTEQDAIKWIKEHFPFLTERWERSE